MGTLNTVPVMLEASGFINNFVVGAADIACGIIAFALILSLIRDGWNFSKGTGSSSMLQILGKILTLILMIGIIVFVSANYLSLGDKAGKVAEDVIEGVEGEIDPLVNGGDTGGNSQP